jgi:hypothetical protein
MMKGSMMKGSMMKGSMMKCKNCIYFKKNDSPYGGRCYLNPPVVLEGEWWRPFVDQYDFCSYFKQKPVV